MSHKYRSIDRHRTQPRNSLSSSTAQPIIIPTTNTYRHKLVKDIDGLMLDVADCGLEEPPHMHQVIRKFRTPSKEREFDGVTAMLNLSHSKKFLYVTDRATTCDGTVINVQKHIRKAYASPEGILFELKDFKRYVTVECSSETRNFRDSLTSVIPVETVNRLSDIEERIRSSGLSMDKRQTPAARRFPTIDPSNMYDTRLRSGNNFAKTDNLSGEEKKQRNRHKLPPVEIKLETPANFYPPLKHKFNDGKTFTITYNDFKTLYNNDWINDTIIDFFIKYEIDQVVSKGIMKSTDVYALNSFFFSKMMSKPLASDTKDIDYYQNVAKWVQKIDLFSYNNVIVPINENLHWYGCIMIGLTEFLAKKTLEKKILNNVDKKDDLKIYNNMSINEDFRYKNKVNIFVIDSLGHKHINIHSAFRTFLSTYCKEKYDIEMLHSDITFRSTKVPKQNNFNDCGIHVIYNLRKFLNDRTQCLDLWDKNSYKYKEFFKGSERSGLRKELINFLLDLHYKETGVPNSTPVKEVEEVAENVPVEVHSPREDAVSKPQHIESEQDTSSTQELESDNRGNGVEEEEEDDDIKIIDMVQLDNVRLQRRSYGRRKEFNVTVANGINRKVTPQFRILPKPTPEEASAKIKNIFGLKSSSEDEQEGKESGSPKHELLLNEYDFLQAVKEFNDGCSEKEEYNTIFNKSLNTTRIAIGMSEFTVYLFNKIFPPHKTFDDNQTSSIHMFKKSIQDCTPGEKDKVLKAYRAFKHEYDGLHSDRPRNEAFRINPQSEPAPETPATPHDRQGTIQRPSRTVLERGIRRHNSRSRPLSTTSSSPPLGAKKTNEDEKNDVWNMKSDTDSGDDIEDVTEVTEMALEKKKRKLAS